MGNQLCCKQSNRIQKVKSIEVYNRNFKFLRSTDTQSPAIDRSIGKSKVSLQRHVVLASTPLDEMHHLSRQFSKGKLQEHPKKTILKSNYDNLIQQYSSRSEKWVDKDFPPNDASWGDPTRRAVWKRISEIIPNAKFVQNNFSPSDILQGKVGDCYFFSSVAGLAQNHQRIVKIFGSTEINKNGIYMARLLFKGVFQQVVVDDYFPFSTKGQFLGAKPAGNEIWVMVLQKCWAKMFGSYQAIDGGFPEEVLGAISAAPTYHFEMTQANIANDPNLLENLWRRMVRSEEKKYVVCAGSAQADNIEDLGLVKGHAYTVLDVFEKPQRLVKLRNPWGYHSWTGKASQRDKGFWSKLDSETKRKMNFLQGKGDDGVFFMTWRDFTKYFNMLDFCNYQDNSHYYYHQQVYQKYNPLFYQIQTNGGTNTFTLSQASARERARTQNIQEILYAEATFILAMIDHEQVHYIESSTSNMKQNFYLTSKDMQPGKYVLITFMDGPQKQFNTTLSIYTSSNTTMQKSTAYNFDFLSKVWASHAKNNPQKKILSMKPQEWLCCWFVEESKFGYWVIHIDQKSNSKIELFFNQNDINNGMFTLLPSNTENYQLQYICRNGQELVIICKLFLNQPKAQNKSLFFPQPQIKRLTE